MEMPVSQSWFARASKVIPGGVYGHTSPAASLPLLFPLYAASGEGCHYLDPDGNRYLDFLCAYGPVILGYHHPEVEKAAAEERSKGLAFNHPTPVMVELAELLTRRVGFASWTVFGKNGSDMTTWAIQVSRQHTGRKKILAIKGAYHGVDAWTNPSPGGIIEEDRVHIHRFVWNDTEAFRDLVNRFKDQIAAIILTPFHHPAFGGNQLPAPGFFETIQETCAKEGIVVILDDIRAGFRLHANGSHHVFPIHPDIACYCKAIGNGYAISAAAGTDRMRQAAGQVFLTGSYWNDPVAMAAAKTCLEVISRDRVPGKLEKLGSQLLEGLERAGKDSGHPLKGTPPAATPYIVFDGDPDLRKIQRFSGLCAERGVIFHPHHNWFMSAAHTPEDVEHAIEVAREALRHINDA